MEENDRGQDNNSQKLLQKGGADLRSFLIDPIKDGLESRLAKAAFNSGLLIVLVSHAEPFRAKIERISKGLVDTFESIPTGHEDLDRKS